jgi:hypothetical protein
MVMITHDNHKSAKVEPKEVNKLLLKEVSHGFLMPVLPKKVPRLLRALVQPFRMAKQTTLDEDGNQINKYCLTQDLLYLLTGPKTSVNSRIDMSQFVEMMVPHPHHPLHRPPMFPVPNRMDLHI